MLVSDFGFELPEELIAQHPPAARGSSRMLRLDRRTGAYEDRNFSELPELLGPGDLLVLNDSRVLPARLFATRGGLRTQKGTPAPGGVVEVLLTEQVAGDPGKKVWNALVKPAKKVPVGETLLFAAAPGAEPLLRADVIGSGEFGERTLRFESLRNFHAVLERIGHMPLPPYIRREKLAADSAEDRERYQTVYSRPFGGVVGAASWGRGEQQVSPLRPSASGRDDNALGAQQQVPFGNDNQKGNSEMQVSPLRASASGRDDRVEVGANVGGGEMRGSLRSGFASGRNDAAVGANGVAGSAAAPTAGLHFTPEILEQLRARGVEIARVTLHVGLGTFQPVRVERTEQIRLHAEPYTLSAETAATLNRAWKEGRRIVGVGTTTTRTLEHLARQFEARYGALSAENPLNLEPHSGSTGLFLSPGPDGDDDFKLVRGLLTNFHLPESTLIMLVSAFAGREKVLAAYAHAVRERYRFFSYGDCMLVL